MKERVERLLEARVGVGNAVVEVAVETETETEEIRERRFDPEGRVAISTDTEERTSNSTEGGSGDVTVASNLPDREGGEGDSSSSQNSETRERINFEVSETEREVLRAPGSIKRLTVAVLVNDETSIGEDGQISSSPRSEEELQSLRELVSSAVGYNEERGDVITIKSMALQSIAPTGTEVSDSLLNQFQVDLMSAIQMAVLALVTLILGLFVIKPLLSKPNPLESADTESLNSTNTIALGDELSPATDGGSADTIDLPELDLNTSLGDLPELPGLPNMGMPAASSDPVDRLRTMIGDRQEESVQILRTWLEEERGETTV
jgi:flagellar M-ring protein FliF